MLEPNPLRLQTIRKPITKNMFGVYNVYYAGILKTGQSFVYSTKLI